MVSIIYILILVEVLVLMRAFLALLQHMASHLRRRRSLMLTLSLVIVACNFE